MSICPEAKRARVSAAEVAIADLPDGALSHISGYLRKEPRALLAVAMTAPSSSFRAHHVHGELVTGSLQRARLEAILGNERQWDHLNFGCLDQSVGPDRHLTGRHLTDDDLCAVLVVIDAVNILESLNLRDCLHIDGSGMDPLRGSTALERIDLSSECLSMPTVVPILQSMVEKEGCSLRHIQLPKKWRLEKGQLLDHFIQKFNNLLRRSPIPCAAWNCGNTVEDWLVQGASDRYGLQPRTCYGCTDHYCRSCSGQDRETYGIGRPIDVCNCCERAFCRDCEPMAVCLAYPCEVKPTCGECGSDWEEYCEACDNGPLCFEHAIHSPCCGQVFCRVECVDCCDKYWTHNY